MNIFRAKKETNGQPAPSVSTLEQVCGFCEGKGRVLWEGDGFFARPEERTCHVCGGGGSMPTRAGWELLHFLHRHKYIQLDDLAYLLAALNYPDLENPEDEPELPP